jgi:hypothetical protein
LIKFGNIKDKGKTINDENIRKRLYFLIHFRLAAFKPNTIAKGSKSEIESNGLPNMVVNESCEKRSDLRILKTFHINKMYNSRLGKAGISDFICLELRKKTYIVTKAENHKHKVTSTFVVETPDKLTEVITIS